MKGTPGQIRVENDTISGDGGDYRDKTVDIRGGILARVHQDGLSFVGRGNVGTLWDFELADFTTDGAYQKLDLSSIIPRTAKAVLLHVTIKDDAAGSLILFTEDSTLSTERNRSVVRTQVANVNIDGDIIVSVASDRTIKYLTTAVTFTEIYVSIGGWWQ